MAKKKVKKFNLKEQYVKSWNYLKDIKNFILVIILIFFISAFIGFFIQPPQEIVQMILEYVQELLEKTQGMSYIELTGFIFFNNLKSSFMVLIFGFLFGILPIISTLANGYMVGFVSAMSVEAEGFVSLWQLVPHGIFELPAVFISLGMGLKFGTFIFQKEKLKSFEKFLKESLRVFVFIVLPLLIIAAIIEGSLISF